MDFKFCSYIMKDHLLYKLLSHLQIIKYTVPGWLLQGICGFFYCLIISKQVQAINIRGSTTHHKPTAIYTFADSLVAIR